MEKRESKTRVENVVENVVEIVGKRGGKVAWWKTWRCGGKRRNPDGMRGVSWWKTWRCKNLPVKRDGKRSLESGGKT
jgi:hypothetical protein